MPDESASELETLKRQVARLQRMLDARDGGEAVAGEVLLSVAIPIAEFVDQYDEQGKRIVDDKGRGVLKHQPGRTLSVGKTSVRIAGETVVSLIALPDGHTSEMSYEVRIEHPMETGAPEIFRFDHTREEDARRHYKIYVTALATQSGHDPAKMLQPATFEGKLSQGN